MIVSHKYKFIFIKTVKTAGTSIEVYLSAYCGDNDVVTPIWPHVEPHRPRNYRGVWNPFPEMLRRRGRGTKAMLKIARDLARRSRFYNHISALSAQSRLPSYVWRSYFKFCVERNPWDKTLSHYHFMKDRLASEMSFQDYLDRGKLCWNHPLYCNPFGQIMVDRVLKFESLSSELSDVFGQLGVPFDGTLGIRAKSGHRADKRPYQEVYSQTQRTLIERSFKQEIQLHSYRFEPRDMQSA